MATVHYHTGRFPPEEERLDWPVLIPLIGPTAAAVARYDGMLAAIPDPPVLLAPLTTREAVLSSRIEGTEAAIAVRAQAEENLARTQGIIDLYDSMKSRVADLTRSRYAIQALDWIFERPIFSSSDFVTTAGIPEPTARRFLKVLRGGEILRELNPGRGRRAGVLLFPEILNVVEGDRIF